MRDAEELIRRRLAEAAEPAEPAGTFERVLERRTRRRRYRRAGVAGLVVLVIAGTAGGTYALWRVFDRGHDGPRPATATPPGTMANGHIAFASDGNPAQAGGVSGIYVTSAAGAGTTRLTDPSIEADHPAWSPDGSMIAFDGGIPNGAERDIYVMGADGSGLRVLTQSTPGKYADPAWSPDQRTIYFVGDPEIGEQGSLFALDLATGNVRWVARANTCPAAHPAVAPDGSRIAIRSECPDGTGSIYLVNPDGTGLASVPGTAWAESGPSWSPDGRTIVLSTRSGVEAVAPDGSGMRMLTTVGASDPAYSPDGTAIIFTELEEGGSELFVMGTDGSKPTLLWIALPVNDSSPSWQPVPPGGVPSPSPTPPPTPAPSPSISLEGGPCGRSAVTADFDGDGQPDNATIQLATCSPIAHQGTGYAWTIEVTWAPAAGGAWALPDCTSVCTPVAVVDLDGNGTGELVLEVDQGASTSRYEVFEVWASEIGPQPATVVPPGTLDHPGGKPLVLSAGGSVTHQDFVTCRVQDGAHQVIATSYTLDQALNEYRFHQLVFDVTSDQRQDNTPTFAVASVNDSTRPFTADGGPLPVDGDPCWPTG